MRPSKGPARPTEKVTTCVTAALDELFPLGPALADALLLLPLPLPLLALAEADEDDWADTHAAQIRHAVGARSELRILGGSSRVLSRICASRDRVPGGQKKAVVEPEEGSRLVVGKSLLLSLWSWKRRCCNAPPFERKQNTKVDCSTTRGSPRRPRRDGLVSVSTTSSVPSPRTASRDEPQLQGRDIAPASRPLQAPRASRGRV